jgi:hypothetical protein
MFDGGSRGAPSPAEHAEGPGPGEQGRRRTIVALVLAALLGVGVWLLIGQAASYSKLAGAIGRAQPWWLVGALAAAVTGYVGYALLYQAFAEVGRWAASSFSPDAPADGRRFRSLGGGDGGRTAGERVLVTAADARARATGLVAGTADHGGPRQRKAPRCPVPPCPELHLPHRACAGRASPLGLRWHTDLADGGG